MMPDLDSLRERAWNYLNPKRIPHVAGCEKEAVKLAERWGEDVRDAAVAGMLHDCTKKLSYPEHLAIILEDGCEVPEELLAEKKLLHAVTGAIVARRDFDVSEKIASAIRWHTTGKPEMSLLEKIIYLADYIEETRDFEDVDKLRAAAYKNIDEAMALGLRMSAENIRERGTEPYVDSLLAMNYYLNLINRKE